MPDFYTFLRIDVNIAESGDMNFVLLNKKDKSIVANDYFIHIPTNLIIMQLLPDYRYYTVLDNDSFELMKKDVWKLENSTGYIFQYNGFFTRLHRYIMRAKDIGIIHHMGHTFDNRIGSLKDLQSEVVHKEIHDIYEKCPVVGVNRCNEKVIETITELSDLLHSMAEPEYLSYRSNPDLEIHRTIRIWYDSEKLIELRDKLV